MATLTLRPLTARTGSARRLIESVFAKADVIINGHRPWDIQVHHPGLFRRVARQHSLGLGESYMDSWWDCARLDEFFDRILRAGCDHVSLPRDPSVLWAYLRGHLFNLQSCRRAFEVGEKHYDLGNDLYEAMLDPRMVYSCAYWRDARTLDEAQEAKLDLACRKLGLARGMTLLDIGCGWGSLALFAAERYSAQVTGLTVSREQATHAAARCKGMPVEIRLEDYRNAAGAYDRIVSIGMFEHVGRKNYSAYFDVAARLLNDGGLFLLHTIGRTADNRFGGSDPWIGKYIFPNGQLPSALEIRETSGGRFTIQDWHGIGPDYDKTLMAWYRNFVANWPRIEAKYGERFYRMWTYYLQSCAAMFRARRLQVWQVVFSKAGEPREYVPVR